MEAPVSDPKTGWSRRSKIIVGAVAAIVVAAAIAIPVTIVTINNNKSDTVTRTGAQSGEVSSTIGSGSYVTAGAQLATSAGFRPIATGSVGGAAGSGSPTKSNASADVPASATAATVPSSSSTSLPNLVIPPAGGACLSSPCVNGGICYPGANLTEYACVCRGFYGLRCENECIVPPNCALATCTDEFNVTCTQCMPGFYPTGNDCVAIPVACPVAGSLGVCYDTLQDAVEKAPGVNPEILLSANVTLDSSIPIRRDTTIRAYPGIRPVVTVQSFWSKKGSVGWEAGFLIGTSWVSLRLIGFDMVMQYTGDGVASAIRTPPKSGVKGVSLFLEDMLFSDFDMAKSGSAVFISNLKYIYVDRKTIFRNNTVSDPGESGGALAADEVEGGLINGVFEYNRALSNHSDGGGIFFFTVTGALTVNGTFTHNWAMGGSAVYVFTQEKTSYIELGGVFHNNTARRGTLLVLNVYGTVVISGDLRHNAAQRSAGFRPNNIWAGAYVKMNGYFFENKVEKIDLQSRVLPGQTIDEPESEFSGGLLDVLYIQGTVEMSGTFERNYAFDNGGVAMARQLEGGTIIFNGVFKTNLATRGGVFFARIMDSRSSATFNGTFVRNWAKSIETSVYSIGWEPCGKAKEGPYKKNPWAYNYLRDGNNSITNFTIDNSCMDPRCGACILLGSGFSDNESHMGNIITSKEEYNVSKKKVVDGQVATEDMTSSERAAYDVYMSGGETEDGVVTLSAAVPLAPGQAAAAAAAAKSVR
eukprot:comp23819_c0_seq1/m.41499 comp23819_c0_seq1/g.41499  ORF comp23819_c0_seq1/g.41499 comp23819_c0_seq1/m.41499 type:complete len:757 (-) comp23819_c0_seq1:180-2450(-)